MISIMLIVGHLLIQTAAKMTDGLLSSMFIYRQRPDVQNNLR